MDEALTGLDVVRIASDDATVIAANAQVMTPHLVLFDAGSGQDCALEIMLCVREVANHESLSILALFDQVDDTALVRLFEAGADDVAGRAFHAVGLRSRVLAHLRRIEALRRRTRIERGLLDKALMAEKATAAAELAGAAAHELNQPLTSILTALGLTRRIMPNDARLQQVLETLEQEANRMAEMIRKLSNLTRYATKDYVGAAKIIDLDVAHGDGTGDD
ncbi:MAG: hypothetical protein MUC50_15000 [Myxococcota bacterium]|nr:hypothetical protein [Myxococcota bacterium]